MTRQIKILWVVSVLAALIAAAGAAISIVGFIGSRKAPPPKPCSTVEVRCIEIKMPDGTRYEFNDFRFYGQDCIAFVSLPDNVPRDYCGDYALEWIGPVGEVQAI